MTSTPSALTALMSRSLTISGGTLFNYITTKEALLKRSKAVMEGIQKGWLKLRIDHEFPLEKAAEAHRQLEERKSSGKVLLKIS